MHYAPKGGTRHYTPAPGVPAQLGTPLAKAQLAVIVATREYRRAADALREAEEALERERAKQ